MKQLQRKLKSFFHNKTTFMMIPHSEKGVISLHLSNMNLFIIALFFLTITITGIIISFKTSDRMSDYEYYLQQNNYYQKQIETIHDVLPNITKSQSTLFNRLDEVFTHLGIENKNLENINEKTNRMTDISYLDNIDDKVDNISNYIKNFKNLFNEIPSIFPLVSKKFWYTSRFGWRRHPISGKYDFHQGLDIAAFPGTPIQATADGEVKMSGWWGGYGNVIVLKHSRGYSTRYGHMLRTAVGVGAFVKKGQVIGFVGTTGNSTGYHLHYEVRINEELLDPASFISLERFWR